MYPFGKPCNASHSDGVNLLISKVSVITAWRSVTVKQGAIFNIGVVAFPPFLGVLPIQFPGIPYVILFVSSMLVEIIEVVFFVSGWLSLKVFRNLSGSSKIGGRSYQFPKSEIA